MTLIVLNLTKCSEPVSCPYLELERTMGAGYAEDYWCTAKSPRKKIAGYVEWPSEVPEVPEWCPKRK